MRPMDLPDVRLFLRTAMDGGTSPLILSFNKNPGHFASYLVDGQGHDAPNWLVQSVESRLSAAAARTAGATRERPVPQTRKQRHRS